MEESQYNWLEFDLRSALDGTLVGFKIDGQEWNLSKTNRLKTESGGPARNCTTIEGMKLWIDDYGQIIETIPHSDLEPVTTGEGEEAVTTYTKVLMVTATIEINVSNKQTRAGGSESDVVTLSSLTPRDSFAISIINAMIQRMEEPFSISDSAMLQVTQNAYRWANAMVMTAVNNRYTDEQAEEYGMDSLSQIAKSVKEGVAIKNEKDKNTGEKVPFELDIKKVDGNEIHKGVPVIGSYTDSQGNTADPILLDIKKVDSKQIYQGLPIVGAGTTSGEVKPVLTKLDKDSEIKKILEITEMKKLTELTEVKKLAELTEIKKLSELTELKKLTEVTEIKAIPHVDIDTMPAVTINGTPSVNVANSPTVTVSNMPSEPIEIEGTVSVDNFPTSE